MVQPEVLLLTGYGINCGEETAYAFQACGAKTEIIHVNDLIATPKKLNDYQIFVVPGGFSYGDDTGSGNALANKMRHTLWSELMEFVAADRLVLGICNGFQVLVNLGLLPGGAENVFGERRAALIANRTARYECRWVNLAAASSEAVFLRGVKSLYLPVAHGEGRFFATPETLAELKASRQIALRYVNSENQPAAGVFPANPNGSLDDIAALCAAEGRILGLMPHPERAFRMNHLPSWPEYSALNPDADWQAEGPGKIIFANAVDYFS
ncbi:MAG: phosphoribosylformylglycinamidine synthase I [Deltaproteobacteria bacterium]|nr:phosphoribosylformylglycinamidine synthase I [Deltaproteobacteria bacterium]